MKKTFFAAILTLMTLAVYAEDFYTVSEILDVYNSLGLAKDATSSGSYTVRGFVTQWRSGYPNYQNADFYIDDVAGGESTLECFRLTGQTADDKRKLELGEYVEANGKLKNYNGRAELVNGSFHVIPYVQKYTLTVIAGTGGKVNSEVNGEYESGAQVTIKATPNAEYTFLQWSDGNTQNPRIVTITENLVLRAEFKGSFNTVADLMKIYQDLALASGSKSSETYTARGYVTKWKSGYPSYQNADFFVDDYADGSTSMLECFRLIGQNSDDKRALEVGEYVEFTGKLQNYNGRAEVCDGSYRIMEAPEEEETSGCYKTYEGMTGTQILATLHEQIKDPDTVTYRNLRADLSGVDYRPDGMIWDMYSGCSFSAKSYCTGVDVTEECDCYNREHVVPQSYWGNDNSKRMRTDLHNVIPADAVANETRSAWAYGEVTGTTSWTNGVSKLGYGTYGNNTFEPADEFKGDLARVYFYMLACYSGEDFTQKGTGSRVFTFNNGQAGLTTTAKSIFLKWHRNDPVSEKEISRNNGIEAKQHNRNPFIDMPELIEYIWGKNSGKVYTCSSAMAIDEVEQNAAPQAVKRIENGILIIEMLDGTRFNTIGIRIR